MNQRTINILYSSRKFRPHLCSTWPGFESWLDPMSWGFYCWGAGVISLSSNALPFCFLFFSEGLWLFLTHMSLVLSRVVCPLSLIIAFGPVSWQKTWDLFCLAWTTLFLPDYWCYFTQNNTALCLLPVQGQSLRGISAFRSNGERRG